MGFRTLPEARGNLATGTNLNASPHAADQPGSLQDFMFVNPSQIVGNSPRMPAPEGLVWPWCGGGWKVTECWSFDPDLKPRATNCFY